MRLPNSLKREKQLTRETLCFGGLDRRENALAGTLSDCENLSSVRFPCLCPRGSRQLFENVTDADDAYSWNGKLVLCRGGKLWCDGTALCDVTAGKKQFATVNTKLVVWPDKLLVDGITGKVRKMDASVTSSGIDTEMTDCRITLPVHPQVAGEVLQRTLTTGGSRTGYWFQVYTGLRWDAENGYAWDGVEWREIADNETLKAGDVLIPVAANEAWQLQLHTTTDYAAQPVGESDTYAAGGYYLTVSEITGDGISYSSSGRAFALTVSCTLHHCGMQTPSLTSCFRAGDAVSVSGHPISRNNRENLFLTDVTEDTLTFAADSFLPCTAYAELGAIRAGKEPAVGKNSSYVYQFEWQHTGNEHAIKTKVGSSYAYVKARAGQKILVDETGSTPKLWLMEPDETLYELVFSSVQYSSGSHTLLQKQSTYPLTLTLKRSMPELDYICEKDNRLWGVVNRQSNRMWDGETEQWVTYGSRLICASSLGMPDDCYDYTGAYSGAYAVAVA